MAKKIAVKNKISLGKVTIDDLALMTAKGFEEVDAKLNNFRTEVKKSFEGTATKAELNNFRTEVKKSFEGTSTKAELSDFRAETKKAFAETVTKTELKTELNNFRTEVNQKFATVDGKLTAIIQKLETLDQREEFVLLEKRVCRLEKAMSAVN